MAGPRLSAAIAIAKPATLTILILHLRGASEHPVGDFHPAPRAIVRPIQLAFFTQLGEDLGGLLGISPYVIPVAVDNKANGSGTGRCPWFSEPRNV